MQLAFAKRATDAHGFAISCAVVLTGVLCGGGCGGGGGGGDEEPPHIAVQAPRADEIVNTKTPRLLIEVGGADVHLDSLRVEVDHIDVTAQLSQLVTMPTGSSAVLPALADGPHVLRASIEDADASAASEVRFTISTGGGVTVLRGLLLDPAGNVPIVGARMYLEEDPDQVSTSDASGRYEIGSATSGAARHLVFDPSLLTSLSDAGGAYRYPVYKRVVDVVPGALNETAPCFLPKVRPLITFGELRQSGVFDCQQRKFVQSYTLATNLDGNPSRRVELTINAGTYVTFLDASVDTCAEIDPQFLSIAPVDPTHPPSNLPPGTDPSELITVQPTGMRFHIGSVTGPLARLPISFPNTDELAVGTLLTLFSVNHETGTFEPMGSMEVRAQSPDRIVTISGGLQGGSWHCPCPPGVPTEPRPEFTGDGMECQKSVRTNPEVHLETGLVRESFALPTRILFDEPFGLVLAYGSASVVPTTITRLDVTIPRTSAIPKQISLTASLEGISAGGAAWYRPMGLSESQNESLDLAYEVDLAGLSTGVYRLDLAVQNHFKKSSTTTFVRSALPIVRIPDGPFGRGWSLAGDDRVIEGFDGRPVVVEGAGDMKVFGTALRGGLRMTAYTEADPGSVAAFFAGRTPRPFVVHKENRAPITVTDTVVPDLDFKKTASPYLHHLGADGIDDTGNDLADPEGDDIVFVRPGASAPGDDPVGTLYEGWLRVEEPGEYDLSAFIDPPEDNLVVELNGTVVLKKLDNNGTDRIHMSSESIFLPSGEIPLRVAHADEMDEMTLRLLWRRRLAPSSPWSAAVTIPTSAFRPRAEDLGAKRLRGNGSDFSTLERLDGGGWAREWPDGARDVFGVDGRIVTRTDRRGRVIGWERDGQRLTRVSDPAGSFTDFVWTGNHVAEIRDPAGRVTELHYSGTDLTHITDASSGRWSYEYSSAGLLTGRSDPDGIHNTHRYDSKGRFMRTEYPDATKREVRYANGIGLATGLTVANAATAMRPAEVAARFTDEGGKSWEMRDDRGKRELTTKDPLGRMTTEKYDFDTRLPIETTLADGVTKISREWDFERGLLLAQVEKGDPATASDDRRTEFEWTAPHAWLAGIKRATGSGVDEHAIRFVLDAHGNVREIVEPYVVGNDAITRFEYDGDHMDALKSVTDPDGVTSTFTRDHPTRSTTTATTDGKVIAFARSPSGDVASVTAPSPTGAGTATTTWARDALGRIASVVDARGGVTEYRRGPAGRLLWVRDAKTPSSPSAPTNRFEYDARGRLSRWLDPLEQASDPTRGQRWAYAPNGRVQKIVDREGHVAQYAYDAVGRLMRIERRRAADQPVEDWMDVEYTALDLAKRLATPSVEILREFTPFGEVKVETQRKAGAPDVRLESDFTKLGARKKLDAKLGTSVFLSVTSTFDVWSDRLETVSVGQGFGAYSLDTLPSGRRRLLVHPNNVRTEYGYDAGSGILDSITNRVGTVDPNGIYSSDTLGLNAANGVASIGEFRSNLNPQQLATTFDYDELSRLLSSASAQSPSTDQDYEPYDAVGNRRSNAWTYDAADRLLADGRFTYEYDKNGNQVLRHDTTGVLPDRKLEYDLQGRMIRVLDGAEEIFTCGYDALGRRVLVDGIRYVYDAEDVIARVDGSSLKQTIVHGPGIDEPWAIKDHATNKTRKLLPDALGSIIQEVEGTTLRSTVRFDAFGNRVATSGSPVASAIAYGYRAREYDAASGYSYNRARFLDHGTGRFLSREPLIVSLLSETRLDAHPYHYAHNSPLEYSDPTGLWAKKAKKIGGALFGAVCSLLDAPFCGPPTDAADLAGELLDPFSPDDTENDNNFNPADIDGDGVPNEVDLNPRDSAERRQLPGWCAPDDTPPINPQRREPRPQPEFRAR